MTSKINDTPPMDYATFPNKDSGAKLYTPAQAPPDHGRAGLDDVGSHNAEDPAVEQGDEEVPQLKPPKPLGMAAWLGVMWTLICIMLAINHWAGYAFITPLALVSFCVAVYHARNAVTKPNAAYLKMLRLKSYKAGVTYLPMHGRKVILTIIAACALTGSFGLVGIVVMKKQFWGEDWGNTIIPDLDQIDDLSPRLALWIWFAGFVLMGYSGLAGAMFGLLLLGVYRVCLHYLKRSQPAAGPPSVPTIKDFLPPVIDCAITHTALSLCTVGTLASMMYGSRDDIWPSFAGLMLCALWYFWRRYRLYSQIEQINLCIDWATDVDCVSVDPQLTELAADREKIQTKYVISGALLLPLFISLYFVDFSSEEELSQQTFAIVTVTYFVLFYIGLWAIWRR